MMRVFYYRYQWICVLIALGFLIASIFYYNEATKLETMPMSDYIIIGQYCHSYQKQSSVHIEYKGKTYTIRVKEKECRNYPINSLIQLVYNNKYDYFYKPDNMKGSIAKVKVMGLLFLLILLPLKYFNVLLKR